MPTNAQLSCLKAKVSRVIKASGAVESRYNGDFYIYLPWLNVGAQTLL